MQLFEFLFLLLFAVAILGFVFGPIHPRLTSSTIAFTGASLIVLNVVLEGWRWQMLPAQLGFLILTLVSISNKRRRRFARAFGALALVCSWGVSTFLANRLPILALPEPDGPFGVGTFEYSVTDSSRTERFSPSRNRELFVEVWYPANTDSLDDYPVQPLYHELYEGDFTVWKFLFSYLRLISTHSHIEAPLAAPVNEKYPVLLFNHGLDGFTSQNHQLMEHLASNGYVIFSIAHPYESIRVNLADAGTVRAGTAKPSDIEIPLEELDTDLLSKLHAAHENWEDLTAIRRVLLDLSDAYAAAADERARSAVVTTALQAEALQPYRHLLTEDSLADYLVFVHSVQGRAVEYWVEDIQFVADDIAHMEAPIEGFSEILDMGRLGVFGMSMGGAAAGEFCKIDKRCAAGSNIDGTQGGRHWNTRVGAPFLMIYDEGHQGENDFAYLPPAHDFWDLTIAGTEHLDFVEIAYTMPIIKTLGFTGPIDGERTIEIVNAAHLAFFDSYLKAAPNRKDALSEIPEISIREHELAP